MEIYETEYFRYEPSDPQYDDIIETSYPFPLKHMRMSMESRAAQFSSFKALSGYEGEIEEASRLTDSRVFLDDLAKAALNTRLLQIKEKINNSDRPLVRIVYFIPDGRKTGGKYVTAFERINRIDDIFMFLHTESGLDIPFNDIYGIDGDVNVDLEN